MLRASSARVSQCSALSSMDKGIRAAFEACGGWVDKRDVSQVFDHEAATHDAAMTAFAKS